MYVIFALLCVLVGLSISMTYQNPLMWRKSKTIKLIERGEYAYDPRKPKTQVNFKTNASTAIYETDDLEYVQKIGIGIPPQNFTVWLKLIASEIYVPHKNCSTGGCQGKRKFVPEFSATFIDYSFEPKWGITIDGIESSCYYGGDVIKIGTAGEERLSIPNIKFGLAESILHYREIKTEFDGILGLSFTTREPMFKTPPTFIERVIETGILEKPVFTMWLGPRSVQKGVSAGQITYGGLDSVNCGPPLTEVPLRLYVSNEYEIDGVRIGGIEYKRKYYAYHTMDTWIMGPKEPVQKMAELAGAQLVDGILYIPCNASVPRFSIYIGNVTLTIASENLILQLNDGRCILAMLGSTSADNYWNVGAPFHREHCTTFDVGAKRLLFSKIISEGKESTAVSRSRSTAVPATSTATYASTTKSSARNRSNNVVFSTGVMMANVLLWTIL